MTKIHKMDLKSKDVKIAQIEKIKQLFPEVIIEGKIDFDKLKLTLGSDIDSSKERYGMSWAGKSGCFKIIQEPSIGTLKPVRTDSIDFDNSENIFIEGDNLEVLKLLQKSYYEKIKIIYIDPPYNTGKDFVYTDKFGQQLEEYLKLTGQTDAEGKKLSTNTDADGRYHSNWMNMMYPRLFLARNLLRDDGLIFISMGENEIYNLKLMCNDIFGEENFIETFLWEKTSTPPSLSYKSRKTVEYILCYEKNINSVKYFGEELDNGDAPLLNTGNAVKELKFPIGSIHFNISDGKYDAGSYDRVLLLNDLIVENGINNNEITLKGEFKWTQNLLNKELEGGTFCIIKSEKFSIRFQRKENSESYKTPQNYIDILKLDKDSKIGTNETANKELTELDLEGCFDYPKPISLMKYLINFTSKMDKEGIILDFFTGSGTTGHATLELNSLDDGNRRFICVQLPEPTKEDSVAYAKGFKNIADISKERIRRAIKKIHESNKHNQKTLNSDHKSKQDLGFKVFKLDRSNFKIWDSKVKDVQQALTEHVEQIKEASNPEDVLYEILLKDGFELTTSIKKIKLENKDVYSIEDNMLLICLDKHLTLNLFKDMKKLNPHRVVVLDKGFNDNDQLKTNAVQSLGKNDSDEFILRSI